MQIELLRKEYTIMLKNILTPIIFEGLQAMYNTARINCVEAQILKTFQQLLKDIKNWSSSMLENEMVRIEEKTSSCSWFNKLVLAVFKTNCMILGIDVSENNINLSTFISYIYIECGREFWIDPFLFYHDYSSLEIKRNNLVIICKIENAIDNAIRRSLPMEILLNKFLKSSNNPHELIDALDVILITDNINKEVQPVVPLQVEPVQVQAQVPQPVVPLPVQAQVPLQVEPVQVQAQVPLQAVEPHAQAHINENFIHDTEGLLENRIKVIMDKLQEQDQCGGGKDKNEKILNIIEKQGIKLSDSSSTLKKIINNSMARRGSGDRGSGDRGSVKGSVRGSVKGSVRGSTIGSLDSKTKNLLLKDLDSESGSYNQTDKYQDIFSNSEVNKKVDNDKSGNKKNREKFFNNYLNV